MVVAVECLEGTDAALRRAAEADRPHRTADELAVHGPVRVPVPAVRILAAGLEDLLIALLARIELFLHLPLRHGGQVYPLAVHGSSHLCILPNIDFLPVYHKTAGGSSPD